MSLKLEKPAKLEPVTVFGGYRIAWTWWWHSEDGWEQEHEFVDDVIYPDEASALVALGELEAAA